MSTHASAGRRLPSDDALANRFAALNGSQKRHLVWLGIFAGMVLTVIGIRFIAVPQAAAFTFGLGHEIVGDELHHVVAMRDLWLGLMAVALAALCEWRALGLWFVMGAAVCVADAAIVASTAGPWWALTFHLASGLFCGWVGTACLRHAKRQGRGHALPKAEWPDYQSVVSSPKTVG